MGARSRLAAAFETTYGTAPPSGYTRLPFGPPLSLSAEQPLVDSELLGYGRDPLAPIPDAVTVGGQLNVPMDLEGFGFWLKAALGAPVTTGSEPFIHAFTSGSWELPSLALELANPEVPQFAFYAGCVVDSLSWTMQRAGNLLVAVSLVAQGETVATTAQVGTPAEFDVRRAGHFQGAILRNGAPLANVAEAEITYANNLDRIETIRGDGLIDGADPGLASLRGRIRARFADTALIDQALAGEACDLQFSYAMAGGRGFTFTAHRVFLPRPRREIAGPQGVQMDFDWQAAQQPDGGPMFTAVLVNDREGY
jgi:hypothetical protein